jgi:hypothetical protein
MKSHYRFPLLALLGLASIGSAQRISPAPDCVLSPEFGVYPFPPLHYPMPSNRYEVEYRLNGGVWTTATVNISYYGGSNSSPLFGASGYTTETSMSFTSVSVPSNSLIQFRVTKMWDAPFVQSDGVSIRPSVKAIPAFVDGNGTVEISRFIGDKFQGEQFFLWWQRGSEGGSVESLGFFLNPGYDRPKTGNIRVVRSSADLAGDLSAYDTLDIEGVLQVPRYSDTPTNEPAGAVALRVPANITTIYLGPGSWLQGKLHFLESGMGLRKRVYGPGVLDVSRFEFDLRFCNASKGYPDQGYGSISLDDVPSGGTADRYTIDGIVITDQNLYATDLLANSVINNVKVLGWNGNNDGLELGVNTVVSNVFIRSGDDSLKIWRPNVTVTNATVWQNYNGGVINTGFYKDSAGDGDVVDGLYVIKTDWMLPKTASFQWTGLANQNNGVIVSLMQPGTRYGYKQTPVFRNIFIEDSPQVLFSLKIVPPRCDQGGLPAPCPAVTLSDMSLLNLQIENLFSPVSQAQNSVGFEILEPGYTLGGADPGVPLPYTLTGSMNVSFKNVFLRKDDGLWLPLLEFDATSTGKIYPNGNVNLKYSVGLP